MITVMVTGVGSNVGQGIIKALNTSGLELKIIATDIFPLSPGLFRCHKGYLVPPAGSDDWLEKIIEICNKELLDMILIGADGEVPFFSKKKVEIEKNTKAIVLVCNHSLVDFCHDKWKTANFFSRHSLPHPKTSLSNPEFLRKFKKQVGFPLVIKPRIGRGARNFFIANNEKQMKFALAYVPDPIIQEYVGGYEFTSGIFFDRRSNVKGIITMQRELKFGTTYRAVDDSFPKVDEEIIRISEVLSQQGAIGPINVQSRYCLGKAYILEINPRFSGTSPIRAYFNFNEAEAAVKHFLLNEAIDELKPSTGVAMRYFEELYITLEDAKQIKEGKEIENSNCIIPRAF